jgi:hypothetical protein
VVFQKLPTGHRVLKKKFSFAALALLVGMLFATKGVILATTTEQVAAILAAFGTYAQWILALVFAADVTDKKLNNGNYNNQ